MSHSVESYSHYVHYTYDPHIHMVLNRDDRSILLYKISDNFYQTCHVCKLKYVRWWIYIKINIEHFHSLVILDWKLLIDYFPSLSIDRPCQEMSHYCEIIVSCIFIYLPISERWLFCLMFTKRPKSTYASFDNNL